MAKGFEQIYGIDYIDSYASVVKQMAWKLVFALAVIYKWVIYKVDAVSAFTHSESDRLLYLEQPKGIKDLDYPEHIIRLNKALYRLKQSARIWYYTLREYLTKMGFIPLNSEQCIFVNNKSNIILCVYIDDIAVIAPNTSDVNSFVKELNSYIKIKNLSPIKDYLGIQIDYNVDQGYLKMSLDKYINKTLIKFSIADYKAAATPIDSKVKVEPNTEKASEEDIK